MVVLNVPTELEDPTHSALPLQIQSDEDEEDDESNGDDQKIVNKKNLQVSDTPANHSIESAYKR